MADLSTSVSVSFEGAGGQVIILEESKRTMIMPTGPVIGPSYKFFRVHPTVAGLRLITTLGSVNSDTPMLSKLCEEVVSFGGSSCLAELHYPRATEVTFEIVGTLICATNRASPVVLTFDAVHNGIAASLPCYGSVHVRYRAPYDLWRAVFDSATPGLPHQEPMPRQEGGSLGTVGPDDDQPDTSRPMTILAYRATPTEDQDPNEVLASLTLTPPDFTQQDDKGNPTTPSSLAESDAHLPQLRFEIDPNYPARLLPASSVSSMEAGVRVRVIPAVQPDISMTSGRIVAWADGPSGGPITEMLTFSNSMSVSLRYQPAGSVVLIPFGEFVDQWGTSFLPRIAGPGSIVTVVEWVSKGVWRNAKQRMVYADEVVVCDTFGNAISAYGVVKAIYSYTYKLFEFHFEWEESQKQFKPAFVVGTTGGSKPQIANIMLTPPAGKGIK